MAVWNEAVEDELRDFSNYETSKILKLTPNFLSIY